MAAISSAKCPACGKSVMLPPGAPGQRFKCPACGERIEAPRVVAGGPMLVAAGATGAPTSPAAPPAEDVEDAAFEALAGDGARPRWTPPARLSGDANGGGTKDAPAAPRQRTPARHATDERHDAGGAVPAKGSRWVAFGWLVCAACLAWSAIGLMNAPRIALDGGRGGVGVGEIAMALYVAVAGYVFARTVERLAGG